MGNEKLVGKHLLELPALLLGDRLGFDDADFVAHSGLAILIMCVKFLRALDDFFETWVWHTVGVFDDDGLVHGCGDDDSDASLTQAGCLSFRFAHDGK